MNFSLKIKISTTRYPETREFYEQVFGMRVAEEWDDPGDRGVILTFSQRKDEAFLEIYDVNQQHSFAGLSLQFRVSQLDEFVKGLPDSMSFEGPTPRPWGSTYLYFNDPNDIQIIVYEGGL